MVPQRPPSGASSWLRFDLNQCVVLSVFRRAGADEAAMVEDKHGRHAAFDPDSARRLCCCRDRRRAFVFGGGNDLSVDVAEARSSPLTNELFHPNMQLSPIPRGFWPPLHFLDNQRSVK